MDAFDVKCFEDLCGLSDAEQRDEGPNVFGSSVPSGEIFRSSERNTNTASFERITSNLSDGFYMLCCRVLQYKRKESQTFFLQFSLRKKLGVDRPTKEINIPCFTKGLFANVRPHIVFC